MTNLEALKLKQKRLNARIQKAEAQLRTMQTKADNRVKILVGAAVLNNCKQGEIAPSVLIQMMQRFLERPTERIAVLGDDGHGSEALKRLISSEGL